MLSCVLFYGLEASMALSSFKAPIRIKPDLTTEDKLRKCYLRKDGP